MSDWNNWLVSLNIPRHQDRTDIIRNALQEKPREGNLVEMPFFCGRQVQEQNCCLEHLVGLPLHPSTLQPTPLAPYQMEFFHTITNSPHHEFHVNKSRQIGFTELMIRIFQYYGFNKYARKLNIIVAGTREKTTKKIFDRFSSLYDKFGHLISRREGALNFRLIDGTEFLGLPASAEAITGLTKVGGIFVDEAAKFNLVDDQPVMNAIKPIVEINRSDLFLVSTPKGRRGFFYNIDMEENSFLKLKYNIWHGVPWIYSKEEAERMLKDPTVDAEQEYLNQYTTSRSSIFGSEFPEEDVELEEY